MTCGQRLPTHKHVCTYACMTHACMHVCIRSRFIDSCMCMQIAHAHACTDMRAGDLSQKIEKSPSPEEKVIDANRRWSKVREVVHYGTTTTIATSADEQEAQQPTRMGTDELKRELDKREARKTQQLAH